jgi:hypothetical protein
MKTIAVPMRTADNRRAASARADRSRPANRVN